MSAPRRAQIVATTVSVLCPYCGECQPNPDNGADSWMPREVKESEGRRACVSCDAVMLLTQETKVQCEP